MSKIVPIIYDLANKFVPEYNRLKEEYEILDLTNANDEFITSELINNFNLSSDIVF